MKNLLKSSPQWIHMALLIGLFLGLVIPESNGQYTCCPKFKLPLIQYCSDSLQNCPDIQEIEKACKGTNTKYDVFPHVAGYTYTWTVVGGVASSSTGNPISIKWGIGSTGYLKVVMSDASGKCKDSIEKTFCLIDAPKASFSATSPVCIGFPVNFVNTSIGGSSFEWNFGDGTTYNGTSLTPTHTYTTAGNYIVSLTANKSVLDFKGQPRNCKECSDIFFDTIVVGSGQGVNITQLGCYGSICPSNTDTFQYSTSSTCTPLTWSIPAGSGTIINPGANPVKIVWNAGSAGPFNVTLNVPSTCTGGCATSTTIDAPVIAASLPMSGATNVCINSINTYSIPVMPGCYYKTTITNSGGCSAFTSTPLLMCNSNTVSINAGNNPGTYDILIEYYDSLKHCGGRSRLLVTVKNKFKINPIAFPPCDKDVTSICANAAADWIVDSAGITIKTSTSPSNCLDITSLHAGKYTISAVPNPTTSFCNALDKTTVIILPNPKLSTTHVLSQTLCVPSVEEYIVTSTVPESEYNWSITGTGNQILTTEDGKVSVKWKSKGKLMVYQSNPCNSDTITFNVDTFLPPTLTPSTTSICEDDTVTYIATPGFPFYIFEVNFGSIVSQVGNFVKVVWPGNSSPYTPSIEGRTCSGDFKISPTINNATASSVSILSTGCNSITIKSSVSASSYLWYKDGVYVATTAVDNYVATSDGYWMCKPVGSICYKKSGIKLTMPFVPKVDVTVPGSQFCAPTGVVGPKTFYSALSVGTPGPITYQWWGPNTNNGSPIAQGTGATFTPSTQSYIGNYSLVVTYGSPACSVTSNIVRIDTGCLPPCTATAAPYSISTPSGSCGNFSSTVTGSLTGVTSILWSWDDGTSNTSGTISGSTITGTHTFSRPGVYNVCLTIKHGSFCMIQQCINYTVTHATDFKIKHTCSGDSLFNTTQILSGFGPATILWSPASGVTVSPTTISPAFSTGNGNMTLSATIGSCTYSISKLVATPSPTVNIAMPTRACRYDAVNISTTPTPSNYSIFDWKFGETATGSTSNIGPTNHAWSTPGTYSVYLQATNHIGCLVKDTETIIIDTLPKVVLFKDTTICKGDLFSLSATSGYPSYNWFNSDLTNIGPPNTSTHPITATDIYYVQAVNGRGCKGYSNDATVVIKPLPKIKFNFPVGQNLCKGTGSVGLIVSTYSHPKYTYSWTSSDPSHLSFSPSTSSTVYVSANATTPPGYYMLYLTVVDTSKPKSCPRTDTTCIYIDTIPKVTITSPFTYCEGEKAIMMPSPNNASLYTYLWSNGVTTPNDTVMSQGIYTVSVANASGCIGSAGPVNVYPKPNLELFPRGCDTFCKDSHLYIPLSNNLGFPPLSSLYPSVKYLIDGTTTIAGSYLYFTSLTLGNHTIQVIVQNTYCIDTSDAMNVHIKDCNMPNSHLCCDSFLKELDNKSFTYSVSGAIVNFTPPAVRPTDILKWDFDCNGSLDAVTVGSATTSHTYPYSGPHLVCLRIERIIGGDTCWVRICKEVKTGIDGVPCVCDSSFVQDVDRGFATSIFGGFTYVPVALKPCDSVFWRFSDGGTAISVGKAPVIYTFTSLAYYGVCMKVVRAISANCTKEICFGSFPKNSISKNDQQTFRVYPTPTNSILYIEAMDKNQLKDCTINLTDMMGRQVLSHQGKLSNARLEINLETIPQGIYLLNIMSKDGESIYKKKIVKE